MYADKSLNVSDKAFSKPANMSIELNCEEDTSDNPEKNQDNPLDDLE
jgi:hypothetical protein